jgi:hypothetical protein
VQSCMLIAGVGPTGCKGEGQGAWRVTEGQRGGDAGDPSRQFYTWLAAARPQSMIRWHLGPRARRETWQRIHST